MSKIKSVRGSQCQFSINFSVNCPALMLWLFGSGRGGGIKRNCVMQYLLHRGEGGGAGGVVLVALALCLVDQPS